MEAALCYRILIIEDDPRMVDVLRRGLWERGHSIVTATTAQEGEQLAAAHTFDVVLLDIGLPDRSGYTVAESLRQQQQPPAIVMLTAQSDLDQVVSGLESGADDYVTKPFSLPELCARIGSVSRRCRLSRAGEIAFGGFVLDLHRRKLLHGAAEVRLTRAEYLLLRELGLHRDDVVTRRQLMQAVWGTAQITQGALDTLMNCLREKLDSAHAGSSSGAGTSSANQEEFIVTVRGSGYCLRGEGLRRGAVTP